ncbi:hypothetical protein R1flu_006971 [Riccia fluitans]|uniref:Attractin/MKLN-like beta-propeller domain-containing protein n=1 Tax=Riccia fluitans TaxID=41844 RepID=A0ABD1YXI5_9MARC
MPRPPIQPWVPLPGHKSLEGRAGHTATLVGQKFYVLGGRNGNEFFNDLWVFDIESSSWTCLQKHVPLEARAYHSATLMNANQIWVIGGSDHLTMYGDVHVLNTDTLQWTHLETSGELAGKLRGTHAALQHPLLKKVILIFGGYSGDSWLNDICTLRTDTLMWETVRCKGGIAPSGRGYHTFTAFSATRIVLFGGKGDHGIVSSDEISVYDVEEKVWMTPRVKGVAPLSRSNHAAVCFDDDLIVIHGGRHAGSRLDDFCLLRILSSPQKSCLDYFEWEYVEQEKEKEKEKAKVSKRKEQQTVATTSHGPGGRSAHVLITAGSSLYLIGGYGGGGYTFSDIFVIPEFIKFVEAVVGKRSPAKTRPKGEKKTGSRAFDIIPGSPEGEGWRSTKKTRRASHPFTKPASSAQVHILDFDDDTSPKAAGVHADVSEPALEKDFMQRKSVEHSRAQIHSTVDGEQMARTEVITTLQGRTNALAAQELHQKEMATMQQVVHSLKAELHGKNLLESELRSGKAALEENILLLRKQVEEGSRTTMEQQSKMEKLKSETQDLISQLDEKKKEVFEVTHKLRSSELKVEELSRFLQQMTNSYSSSTQELSTYKLKVEQLEVDIEKKAQELQHLHLSHRSERTALNKEIAERRSTTERLTNELEVSKTSALALQETVDRLVKHTERDSAKIDALQKEQEDLKSNIAVLTTERDELIAKKEQAEASAELVKDELRVARNLAERNTVEIGRLKENADQAKEHIGSLHLSLKKNEDELKVLTEENCQLRAVFKEIEDFETNQARSLQKHAEKLRCTRQFGPPS